MKDMEHPTKGRFRGEEIHLVDARMMLTDDELDEVEVTLEDGGVIRPFRGRFDGWSLNKDGIPSI